MSFRPTDYSFPQACREAEFYVKMLISHSTIEGLRKGLRYQNFGVCHIVCPGGRPLNRLVARDILATETGTLHNDGLYYNFYYIQHLARIILTSRDMEVLRLSL